MKIAWFIHRYFPCVGGAENYGRAMVRRFVSAGYEVDVLTSDAHDLWYPLERQDYHSSPAMRLTGRRALEMAGIGVADLTHIDLYSCFPSAVQVGAESLGLDLDDPRGLTVTGGLPYFGGPGNNYALHAIATLVQRLRGKPDDWGLSTANGWCYVDDAIVPPLGNPAITKNCPTTEQRQIRFVNSGQPAAGATVFITCEGT